MIPRLLAFLSMLFLCTAAYPQDIIRGFVLDLTSSEPMPQVVVQNLKTGQKVVTDTAGAFRIGARLNEILIFEQPGYRKDSLLVTEFGVKRVYLTVEEGVVVLDEVLVQAMTQNKLQQEMAIARRQGQAVHTVDGGGLAVSPSRLFGREGKEARRKYRKLKQEADNRTIDARFTKELVSQLLPLYGKELERFMAEHRPAAAFIEKADEDDLRLYIMDAYTEFKKKIQR